jgi:hypothetical protein
LDVDRNSGIAMNIALTVVLLADIFFGLVKSDKANYTEDTKPILVTWITEDLHCKRFGITNKLGKVFYARLSNGMLSYAWCDML